jgi:hypothetical protein
VRYTGLSERTVRTCVARLEPSDIIPPSDPDIVAARIKRADGRPQGWDLNLSLVRNDLHDADVAVLEHQFPGLGARLAARLGDDGQPDEVQSLHPAPACETPPGMFVTRPSGFVKRVQAPGTPAITAPIPASVAGRSCGLCGFSSSSGSSLTPTARARSCGNCADTVNDRNLGTYSA